MTSILPTVLGAGIGPFGPWEIIAILAVVMLLFGAKRLPDLARSFGKSIKEFKKGVADAGSEVEAAAKDEPAQPKNNGTSQTKAEAGSSAKKAE